MRRRQCWRLVQIESSEETPSATVATVATVSLEAVANSKNPKEKKISNLTYLSSIAATPGQAKETPPATVATVATVQEKSFQDNKMQGSPPPATASLQAATVASDLPPSVDVDSLLARAATLGYPKISILGEGFSGESAWNAWLQRRGNQPRYTQIAADKLSQLETQEVRQ